MQTAARSSALLLLLTLAACVSLPDRLQSAYQLEREGRPAEAVTRLVEILAEEPAFEQARVALRRAGQAAISESLEQARLAESAHAYDRAATAFDHALEVARKAEGVGEAIGPADLALRRERVRRLAYEVFVASGSAHADAGSWREALEIYTAAPARYEDAIGPTDEARLEALRAGVHLRWSEEALAVGSNHLAHTQAQYVLGLVDPASPEARRAISVQIEALNAGTRRAIWLHLATSAAWRASAPSELAADLDQILTVNRWSNPPSFVELAADARAIERRLEELHYEKSEIDPYRASRVGSVFGAHFVILTEATSFESTGHTLRASLRYRIVAAASGDVVVEDDFVGLVSGAPLEDPPAELGGGASLPAPLDPATEQELEDELLDQLADGLSEEVFDALLGLIE